MKRRRPTLRHSFFVLSVVIAAVLAAYGFGIFTAYRDALDTAFHSASEKRAWRILDRVQRLYDQTAASFKQHENAHYRVLAQVQRYFRRHGPHAPLEPLQKLLKADYGTYHLHLVDRNNTIVRTTYTPDLGLNLSMFPGVSELYARLRRRPDLIDLSDIFFDVTAQTQKRYIAQKMEGAPYIINIGLQLNTSSTTGSYLTKLRTVEPALKAIGLYRVYDQQAASYPVQTERIWALHSRHDKRSYFSNGNADRSAELLELFKRLGTPFANDRRLFGHIRTLFSKHDILERFFSENGCYCHEVVLPLRAYLNLRTASTDLLVLTFDESQAHEHIRSVRALLVASLSLFVLLLGGVFYFLYRKIVAPMVALERSMRRNIPADKKTLENSFEEIAQTASAYNALHDALHTEIKKNKTLLERFRAFASDIIHQVRTPLSVMKITAEAASGDKDSSTLLRSSIVSTEHMLDTLAHSFQRNSIDFERHPLDLSAFLEKRIETFRVVAEANDMKIEARIRHGIVIDANATEMELFIDNNLSNAIKHGNPGSLVVVTLKRLEFETVLIFENEGSPIEDVSGIFHRYTRENRASQGSGIGLATVADICLRYDCIVDVRHDRGKNRFIYFLPTASDVTSM